MLAALVALSAPAPGDIIYSNLHDTPIPTDFTGLFVDVDGDTNWDLNPFFGGVGVANSSGFQPARTGTANLDPVWNFAAGAPVGSGSSFSTGSGGSQTHLGNTFTAGQEGYLGFTLDGNYGWMRVVLTANSAGALVRDWAYEDSGAPIVTARIHQGAPSAGTQLVTLSPGSGEQFRLGSQVTDTGGNVNSLLKTGAGTATLVVANNYTGGTTVTSGTLLVNNPTDSGTGSGTVSVAAGATIGGNGAIAGILNVSGVLSPGASVESLSSGTLSLQNDSTFDYEVDSSATPTVGADLQVVAGNLNLSGVVTLTLADVAAVDLAFPAATTFSLLNYTGTWNGGLLSFAGNELADNEQFSAGLNTWQIDYAAPTGGSNFSSQHAPGSFINITVVPEPTTALLGCLGLLLLLRPSRT